MNLTSWEYFWVCIAIGITASIIHHIGCKSGYYKAYKEHGCDNKECLQRRQKGEF